MFAGPLIFYIFFVLMHINVCSLFLPKDEQYSSFPIWSKDILRAMLPDVAVNEISLHEGDSCTCNLACQTLRLTTMSCKNGLWSTIDSVDAADCLALNLNWYYFHFERQDLEQRPTKRAFGCTNSASVFKEAQLIDMHSVNFIHLLYGDKSFLGQHRCHYSIYGTYWWYHAIYAKCINYTLIAMTIIALFADISLKYISSYYQLQNVKFYYFTLSLLNIH